MTRIILTTLGTTNYSPATYQWGQRKAVQTNLVSAALKSWLPEAEVNVLLTPRAKEKNGALLLELIPEHTVIPVANGDNDEDNWRLLEAISNAVPSGAEVIFDVTHGFRSLPVVTLLALSYLRIVKDVKLRGVVYGAWEPGRPVDVVTPIFDLTPFVSLLDWAQAANRFRDTGDASLFKPLLAMNRAADYNAVSRQLECLSKTMFSNRGLSIPQEADKLMRVLKRAEEGTLEIHQQPFALVMQQLEQQISPLAAPSEDGELILKAQHALIHWYAERGHYPQAMALAREWLISVRQWRELRRISMDETERECINDDCKAAMKALQKGNRAPLDALPPHLQGLARFNARVVDLRNDLMHFGFKEEPTQLGQMKQRVQNILDDLPAAVRPLGLELEAPQVQP